MYRLIARTLLIVGFALTACTPDQIEPVSPEGTTPEHARRLAPVGTPIIVPGFATPESAVHDARADVYLVSNVNGHPQALTNDGFISRIAPDGTVLEREWVRGGRNGVTLHAPTGVAIAGDVPVATFPAEGLDGIVQSGGFFYITSIFDGSVFRMTTGGAQVTQIMDGLVSPADLGFDGQRNRLLIPSLFGDFVTIEPLR